jgi:DNA helicase II / ATP-dependent DNA helicase PcrA
MRLRPGQEAVLQYHGGRMGIAAVPGSGKTWTLARLAADLVASGRLGEEQEVLVVTLVNSAVDHFYRRVQAFLSWSGPGTPPGLRVRTLHGLAHDMVRERPDLALLDLDFQILDEHDADALRDQAAQAWLDENIDRLDSFLLEELDESRREWVRQEQLPELVKDISRSFIRVAKDARLSPDELAARLNLAAAPHVLLELGCAVYSAYQHSLTARGAVDFDDLIRLALQVLQAEPGYLKRLRGRWPFILEDEAQDSSRLQEQILSLLSGGDGNWVRAGDPNQAIYETFTTASPVYLRRFLEHVDVQRQDLPHSGRSTDSIIYLANALMDWSQVQHPIEAVRGALVAPPYIQPVALDDPQPNPPDDPTQIHISTQRFSPPEELLAVADSIARWLPEHSQETAAVLVPRNQRGFEMVDELRRRGLDVVDDLLRSSSATRSAAGALANVLRYLAEPQSASRLATVLRVWRRDTRDDPQAETLTAWLAGRLRRLSKVEDYLWPETGNDWLFEQDFSAQDSQAVDQLGAFRTLVQRWLRSLGLPPDQLLLLLAQDLISEPAGLATAYQLSVLLRQAAELHPTWRLPELAAELGVIARNERRFLGVSAADTGFDPQRYRGQAAVATLHKAKGLEWDRVYLMSVNDYDFPAGLPDDVYTAEKWYLRSRLNLEAEALARLKTLLNPSSEPVEDGSATRAARVEYARERLRLLYVGITRARRSLAVTWNTGLKGDRGPALALQALQDLWKARNQEA